MVLTLATSASFFDKAVVPLQRKGILDDSVVTLMTQVFQPRDTKVRAGLIPGGICATKRISTP